MKQTLPLESTKSPTIYEAPIARAPSNRAGTPSRVQGGNWHMQGMRRSLRLHDDAECQMSIAEFMTGRGSSEEVE